MYFSFNNSERSEELQKIILSFFKSSAIKGESIKKSISSCDSSKAKIKYTMFKAQSFFTKASIWNPPPIPPITKKADFIPSVTN